MPGISKVHGLPTAGAFYGYSPLVVKISNTGTFTADSGGGASAIVQGGYSKALTAVQTVGSVVWLGAQTNNSFSCIVDAPTFNLGSGDTTTGIFGALKDALVAECGGLAVEYQVTTSTVFNGAGTFTFA